MLGREEVGDTLFSLFIKKVWDEIEVVKGGGVGTEDHLEYFFVFSTITMQWSKGSFEMFRV